MEQEPYLKTRIILKHNHTSSDRLLLIPAICLLLVILQYFIKINKGKNMVIFVSKRNSPTKHPFIITNSSRDIREYRKMLRAISITHIEKIDALRLTISNNCHSISLLLLLSVSPCHIILQLNKGSQD